MAIPATAAAQTAQPVAPKPLASVSGGTGIVPWYLWCGVAAVTSAAIGGAWDVSWHRSIGRDTFWTPAHMAIYACGVLAAVVCGYLIFSTTFRAGANANVLGAKGGRRTDLGAAAVEVFGLRAPLGAFLAAWGGIAMLTSAPFDNWWHAAYGLDVTIVSPPHTLLILGVRAVDIGVLFLLLAEMNRASDAASPALCLLRRLFLYIGGMIVGGQMFFLMEYTADSNLHSVQPYIAMAIALPLVLAALREASHHRWAVTIAVSIYMLFGIGQMLLLPLFPAQPKLGPVFNPVTHMVPERFPILLIVPAIALDLLFQRARDRKSRLSRPWVLALTAGIVFVAVLTAVEWPFANFLMSKWSQNRFFGTMYFDFNARPESFERLRQFEFVSQGAAIWRGLAEAAAIASVEIWLGLRLGRWMQGIRR
jgi:hypothetical protein